MEKVSKRAAFLINLLFFAAVVAIVVLVLRYAIPWLMPFIIGFLVAMIFHPLINRTSKKLKAPRKAVACVIVVLGYAVLIVGVTFGVIEIATLLSGFVKGLPSLFESEVMPVIRQIGDFVEGFYDELPTSWVSTLQSISSSIVSTVTGFVGTLSTAAVGLLTDFIAGVPSFLIALVFTVLASFFITMNYDRTKDFLMYQLDERGRGLVRAVKIALKDTVFAYVRAAFKLMVITFVELAIGLWIIGVDNPVGIAFGIAIFDVLPVFGTGGIVIPWIIICFVTGDIFTGVGLLILYGIITVIRNFIEPKIVGDQLGLDPVVSIIAIYLGFIWFGVFGMIFMPIAVQIANLLHQKGLITLYKTPPPAEEKVENSEETEQKPKKKRK